MNLTRDDCLAAAFEHRNNAARRIANSDWQGAATFAALAQAEATIALALPPPPQVVTTQGPDPELLCADVWDRLSRTGMPTAGADTVVSIVREALTSRSAAPSA